MTDFVPGQRWICTSELNMGLGTVLAVEPRTVTIVFLASGETRTYAKQSAPLNRVAFAVGDRVRTHDGRTVTITVVTEQDGLLTYVGSDEQDRQVELPEGELDNFLQLDRPADRLFSGLIDSDKWFELRYRTLQERNALIHSDLYGLVGCRTRLLPHQLYIAHEVANRYAPRVLLADEVGLGKTIEAGLILHQQLLTERARRVLIVVPESLLHQWLVEMLRRFNLYFSIFDQRRCQAIEAGTPDDNPFHSEQLVLCSLAFLAAQPQRLQQAVAGEWDLLVVDEAHHLQWSPQQTSPEYDLIAGLAAQTPGVLLLTATPEQLGKAGHYARLRLLDPDRYPDLQTFIDEEQRYAPVAHAVEALLEDEVLDAASGETLSATIEEGDNQRLLHTVKRTPAGQESNRAARAQLVEHLLDRHGTGRVLFRNTRAVIKGFPERCVHDYPLPLPAAYGAIWGQSKNFCDVFTLTPNIIVCPERLYQDQAGDDQVHWTAVDPRVAWLGEQLQNLKPAKVLVIAAQASTVLELAQALRTGSGIQAAVFHEGMSIVERDRAAAFFADRERGSQVLLCSEIGSEGRNFQFAHHLVLFDLPLDPDLLEQRIGRLDRIGQSQTIHIHVPYLRDSAQAVLLRWYQEGLGAFEQTCPAGQSVFAEVGDELQRLLQARDRDTERLARLIDTTRALHQRLQQALHQGRDRLLEYNSCRPQAAQALARRAAADEQPAALKAHMDAVFDCFNVDCEEHSAYCFVLHPGSNMMERFPELPEDGLTVTYSRATALEQEDIQYLSWEHPMVAGAMDLVLGSETGNTAVTALRYAGVPRGTLLLECLYILETASSERLRSNRYLPATSIRVLVDEQGRDHHSELSHSVINRSRNPVDAATAGKVVAAREQLIRALLQASERLAQQQVRDVIATAHSEAEHTLLTEINRLRALRSVNPNVREEEIRFFEQQLQTLGTALDQASLRLDALRVIVAT
jgi:ATP-dependent helicase HepA